MKRLALVALAVAGLADCGRSKGPAPDGAVDGPGEVATTGFRAYDVMATLTLDPLRSPSGSWTDFPTTFTFTFAWDPATGESYAGGPGRFGKSVVETTDNLMFHVSGGWAANEPFAATCDGYGVLVLDDVTFSIEGGVLHGRASGKASYRTNATSFEIPTTAELVGVPDVTPPTFTSLGDAVDPFEGLVELEASEPLPSGSEASLVGAPSGDTIRLQPLVPMSANEAFYADGIALRYGETYTFVTDHIVDFAGNKPTRPVTFTTRAAPPLIPEDGFESVTGTMFGGAGVLRGGPLAPLAGQTSLLLNTGYGGGFGFLPYDLGPSLSVRLAVAPGDTVVRFDSELIAPDPIDAASFVGEISLGSVGGSVGVSRDIAGTDFAKVTLPQLGDIYVSPVKTIELPLPAGVAGEITFEIVGTIDLCNQPPSPTVLVVDNLRAE